MTQPNDPQDRFGALEVPYRPRDPRSRGFRIGLVGCGDITKHHLAAYRAADYRVVALCDLERGRAEDRRDEFYPDAVVCRDHRELLAIDKLDVVDIATHPPARPPLVADALRAGKHVLSQKPFVLDLAEGERLVKLAHDNGVLLAVNQNGRWSPHFSYMRHVVAEGWLGDLAAVHFHGHWDHSWVKGLAFEKIRHLILYDYAIHWFDMLLALLPDRTPRRVYASFTPGPDPPVEANLFAQVMVEFDDAQATLVFDGHTRSAASHNTVLVGTRGTLHSTGPDEGIQVVEVSMDCGTWRPTLDGQWFNDGFHGAMGELLCAIEDQREPSNSARGNLHSLALCFAAVASAERHEPIVPGSVSTIPPEARTTGQN